MKAIFAIGCLLVVLSFQGCLVAAIGAGVGAMKYGNAQKRTAATTEKEKYGLYQIEMEKVNLEREKAGLQSRSIMTFDEWQQAGQK